MNLKELKTKASAAEFVLIESVEKLVRENIEVELRRKFFDYISKYPVPGREDFERRDMWLTNLEKHLQKP